MSDIMLGMDVMEAGKERIRWAYRNYPHVAVSWSGGKDSTVVMHLAKEIAEEFDRLPLDVVWVDQELEWESVAVLAREVRQDPKIKFWWFQTPYWLNNSADTTGDQSWIHCWGPEEEWMRDLEPGSVREFEFKKKSKKQYYPDFYQLCDLASEYVADGRPSCSLTGMRIQESPKRRQGMFSSIHIMSCALSLLPEDSLIGQRAREFVPVSKRLLLSPIYDMTTMDVWKAIYENDWPYCTIYDTMYQFGTPIVNMRVSSLCHEGAILQTTTRRAGSLEPETWERMIKRIPSFNRREAPGVVHGVPLRDAPHRRSGRTESTETISLRI